MFEKIPGMKTMIGLWNNETMWITLENNTAGSLAKYETGLKLFFE